MCKGSFIQCFCKNICNLIMCPDQMNFYFSIRNKFPKVMIFEGDVFCPWLHLGAFANSYADALSSYKYE
jgi:hypothetical protein